MENKDKTKQQLQEALQEPTLNEINLSTAGKMFFAGVAAYLGNAFKQGYDSETNKVKIDVPKMPLKIKGTKDQLQAIMDAITASKTFQDEIGKPGATIQSVIDKLNLRNMNKDKFRKITGKNWPL